MSESHPEVGGGWTDSGKSHDERGLKHQARTAVRAVPVPQELRTPLADVPYALRHAAISLWIKSGMDPVEAASRAGHSLVVLYRFYAKLLKGGSAAANRLVELGLRAEE
ncbi:hypothetical protein ACFRH6_16750 [Streptomyces sp. NPDC056749]|uniref:hypothetical protein n=1 Tax=Streptomyces sp. NPDC056749 TaxID=3345936 RepID=UPI0036C6B269